MIDRSVKQMFAASFLFAIMNVLVKQIQHIPVAQIVFMRSIIMFIVVFALLRTRKVAVLGTKKKLLILRGLFGSVGIAFFFYTLHHMPLASAVVVHYITPVSTAIIAFFLMGERLSKWQLFFFALCFIGVFVIKGFDPRVDGFSIIIGIIGTIGAASAYNIISLIKESEHHLVIMFYFPLVTIPLVLIYIFITGDWVWGSLMDWVILLSIGILTYGAQYFLTRSYQLGQVNKVSIISYMGIVYALVFGLVLFDEWYNWKALVGVLLVLAGVLLNVYYKSKFKSLSKSNDRI